MLEIESKPELSVDAEIVNELFQLRMGFFERDQTWHAHLVSIEDNKSMVLTHPNIGKLINLIRKEILSKEQELRGDKEEESPIAGPNGESIIRA